MLLRTLCRILATGAAAAAPIALAASQTLVENINSAELSTEVAGGFPSNWALAGDRAYFSAQSPGVGRELYRLTAAGDGVELVADIVPGSGSAFPARIVGAPDGRSIFSTIVDGESRPYISDGSAAGTVALGANLPGQALYLEFANRPFVLHSGQFAFFAAEVPGGPLSLWTSTAVLGEVQRLNDFGGGLLPGAPGESLASAGGHLWFPLVSGNSWELYRGDGTPGGTSLVESHPYVPSALLEVYAAGGGVVVQTEVPGLGREIYVSDGTAAGTDFVDIAAGPLGSDPMDFVASNGALYFSVDGNAPGGELYRSDGTLAGTFQATDLDALPGLSFDRPDNLTAIGGLIYFSYDAGDGTGEELWSTAGLPGTAAQVADLFPGPASSDLRTIRPLGNLVCCSAETAAGRDVVGVDPGSGGVTVLTDLSPGFDGELFLLGSYADRLYFRTDSPDFGIELFRSDGTVGGVALVSDIDPDAADQGSDPDEFVSLGSTLVFTADGGPGIGRELWRSAPSPAGVQLVLDLDPSGLEWNAPQDLLRFGGEVFFSANDGASGIELWKSDGTAAGTALVREFIAGPAGGQPLPLLVWRDRLFLTAATGASGRELWVSDGTGVGTTLLADIWPGFPSAQVFSLLDGGELLYFVANDGATGRELWRTDGTGPGTGLVADLVPGADPSIAADLDGAVLDGRIFFRAEVPPFGVELAVSDGSNAGTGLFADLDPLGSSNPSSLRTVGGRVVFRTYDELTGTGGLFATDGVVVTALTAEPLRFVGEEGRVFASETRAFAFMVDGDGESVLVSTDGTGPGTTVVAALSPVSNPDVEQREWTVTSGAQVIFLAEDAVEGAEPWVSDGTAAGTFRLPSYVPGPASSKVDSLGRHGDQLFFGAATDLLGAEPVSLPIASFGGYVLESFGLGCPGASGVSPSLVGGGVPAPGQSIELTVAEAAPLGAVGHYFAADYAAGDVGGCDLYLAAPALLAAAPVGADGRSTIDLAIAANPALAGATLWLQSVTVDVGGSLLGVAALTPALEVVFAP